jgi:uncharacterized SAM-binding protein YcdF (DUF218 family)
MKNINSKAILLFKKILKWWALVLGLVFLIIILLAFTEQPFWWYYHLGRDNSGYKFKPDTFVLLGGAGMPSESNLIRAYYTVVLAKKNPNASIIVSLPEDSAADNSSSKQLQEFIINNGIDSTRIFAEKNGKNTREQALQLAKKFPELLNKKVVIITSPEHMYRSIECFKKLNFLTIGGEPCFEHQIDADLVYDDNLLGGRKNNIKIGNKIQLRYQFWNHLKYQILVYREFTAYLYYKFRGWV